MQKFLGLLLVAVVMGFVAPGAFAANGAHRHQQQHHRHHQQHQRQHRHHAA